MPFTSENISNYNYINLSLKFQAARRAAAVLNIEGQLGSPQESFRPVIHSQGLNSAFDTLYIQFYGALIFQFLNPVQFGLSITPQQPQDQDERQNST